MLKASVIISAHNAERYIACAIESVLAQSHKNVECIVVDDGSTDKTADVVQQYGERVSYIYQQNLERSAARNNGIAHATGKYITFLDADDYLSPDKIAEQLAFLEAHTEYDAVYSSVKYFTDNGKRNFYSVKRITPVGDILPQLIFSNFITIHSPLIRKKAMKRTGWFNPDHNRYEDWEFFLHLAILGASFGFIDNCHAFVRIHPENTTRDWVKMSESKLLVAKEITREFGPKLAARGINSKEVLAFHKADYGRVLILNGWKKEGRRLIKESCRTSFPHRLTFRLFALVSGICGHRFLTWLHVTTKHIIKFKYSKGKV